MFHVKPLALIPARAGSKRLPGKHLLELGGKPLIAWTIEAAKASGVFESIVVSSDDSDILALAEFHGLDYHSRPSGLATDHVTLREAVPAICHDLGWTDPTYVLQPTLPFRSAITIRSAWHKFSMTDAHALLSTTDLPVPGSWLLEVCVGGIVRPLFPGDIHLARGMLPTRGSAPYLVRPDGGHWIVRHPGDCSLSWIPETILLHVSPTEAMEIDTPEDLRYARWLLTQPDAA